MACTLGKVNRCQNVGKKFQQEISEARYDSIVNASKRRQDGLYNDITKDSLILHRLCASTYTSNFHIEREEKKRKAEESSAERSNKLLRSDAPRSTNGEVFEFGKHCMYCIDVTICKLSNEYSKQAKKEYIREAYPVTIVNDKSGRSYIDVILGKCDERGEELGRIVRRRIESLGGSDLPAAEARYHKVCKTNFFWNFVKEKKQTEDPALLALFDEMSQNRDRIWNSIELQAEYVSLGGHFIHSRNFILNKIQSYFGDTVTVFYALGFSKIVCFKAETTKLLHLTKQEIIDEDDLDLSISRIASRIRSETKYNQEKRESYSIDIDCDIVRKPVSETLLDLLVKVSPKFHDSLQSLMIGNIVTSTLNNGPTDLQIALGVALRRNKTLIQLLYKYGITCSYDEILLFKYSAAIASTKTSTGDIFEKDGKIIHCVADNYDCEIFSQNCKKTCHCLAMILAQTERLHKTLETAQKTIPRQNMKDRYKEVEYEESAKVPFHMPKNPPMPKSVALKVVPSLSFLCRTIISYQKASHEDMQFMKDITSLPECPEWTGYNTKRSRDAGMIPEPKAKVVFRPLINKTPSDPSTLKTAIQSGLTLVKGAGQDILVFTVDMQLYKVVVDMLFYEPSLFKVVVPMCGGMHMLMNFIHAVCVLLSPAIKPILASTFGSVDRMIKGKKYPQNMRALRIIAEEMLCSILDNNPDILTMDQLIKHLDEESQNSKTTKLWVECLIKPVFIMCAFLRAAREQDFALHYAAAKAMLPYFAAAGGVFYARYGTFYVHHLETLPMKIIEKLMHDCALRITPGIFNAIHTDQVIETTYMRLGHGPGGARGIERDDRQIAVWALSFATCGEVVNNLMDMANTKKSNPNNQHKEESVSRILYDQKDRKSIQSYMARIIDPIDPKTHPGGHLINIVSGEIASEKANPQEAVSKGMEMIKKFKDSWPDGFRATLSKPIITMDTKVRFTKIGDNRVYDQSFIYGRTCGLMASNHNINMDDCLVTEMAPNPPAYFTEEGKMRTTTKYILRLALEERLSERLVKECHTLVYDVSAVLWTISWPNEGSTLQVYINTFKAFAITALSTTPHSSTCCICF